MSIARVERAGFPFSQDRWETWAACGLMSETQRILVEGDGGPRARSAKLSGSFTSSPYVTILLIYAMYKPMYNARHVPGALGAPISLTDDSATRGTSPSLSLGRHVFGAAALAFGVITLAWPDSNQFHQLRYLVFVAGVAQLFGGAAIQVPRTTKAGAVVLGAVYLVFALLCVPQIVAKPQSYVRWGNFFEQFSLFTGAAIVYARSSSVWAPETLKRIGSILLGLCVTSFALEQAIYLEPTASLVPKWLPPGQMFWAVTTTVAFALAAVALFTNIRALLTTRLLTIMIVIFGLLVWMPLLFSDLNNHSNWSETIETFAIAGSAWILADLLGQYRRSASEG
jgi:hypothetical protein